MHFGEPAPVAIWPRVDERFRSRGQRWVDLEHFWVVPKTKAAGWALGLGLMTLLWGSERNSHHASAGVVIFLVLAVGGVGVPQAQTS